MTRRRRPLVSLAGLTVLVLCLVALAADLLASDLPLAVKLDGRVHLLPVFFGTGQTRVELIGTGGLPSLRERVAEEQGAWLVEPPIPYGPTRTSLDQALSPPSREHPFGTDELGRDVLSRMIHGARASLGIGLFAVAIYVLLGVALGGLAGYFGGRVDGVISRVTEVMLSFPSLFLILAVLGLLRAQSLWPVILVLGLTRWTDVSRLVRAECLRLRGLEFVTASRALGASHLRILVSHVLPHTLAPVTVAASFGVGAAILLESALSFLGFGVPAPHPSWGELLAQAHRYVTYPGAWWLTLFPGLALFLTVASFNLLGEALRDAWDPRLANTGGRA